MFKRYLTELEHLHTLASKGQEYIDKLLNEHLCVNIKIDQSAFVVRKVNGALSYYGREGREQITKTKRAGMDIYEDAIAHIEKQKWQTLPDNLEVYLENFNPKLKTIVRYQSTPTSGLIISYCKLDGNLVRPDIELNKHVARVLDVAPPPILFSGKLNDQQKAKIQQFISLDDQQRRQKYGSMKFIEFIMSVFLHPAQLQWLLTAKTSTGESGYEGLVLYFGNDDPVMAKIVDPLFTAAIVDKKKDNQQSVFDKLLQDQAFDFIKMYSDDVVEHFQALGKDPDDNFIAFVAQLTKISIEQHGEELNELLGHFHDQVAGNRFSNINFHLIPSFVRTLVNKYWWAEDLFRVLLFLLQKEKARANPQSGITPQRKDFINQKVATLRQKGLVR
jgi:hypothetical protein